MSLRSAAWNNLRRITRIFAAVAALAIESIVGREGAGIVSGQANTIRLRPSYAQGAGDRKPDAANFPTTIFTDALADAADPAVRLQARLLLKTGSRRNPRGGCDPSPARGRRSRGIPSSPFALSFPFTRWTLVSRRWINRSVACWFPVHECASSTTCMTRGSWMVLISRIHPAECASSVSRPDSGRVVPSVLSRSRLGRLVVGNPP